MVKSLFPKLAVLCVALLVGGCSMIPPYERPIAPVAADWPMLNGATVLKTSTSTSTSTPAADIEWQTFFSDPKLKQLIEVSLNSNRDLQIAVLNIEQARAQFQIRRADQLPTVNAALTGSRQPNVNGSGSISSLYSAGLVVTAYEFDFFGRVAGLKEAALAQYLATQEGQKIVQLSLIANVANLYLSIRADDELLLITQQTLTTREESLRLSKLRFDNGVSSELDYRQAESLTETARVAMAQLVRQRAFDENALTLLVGQHIAPDTLRSLPTEKGLNDLNVMLDVPAGLPSDLLARRPDIRQAEQQLLAAYANIGAARAAFFPRISLTSSLGSASSGLAGLFKTGSWGWTLAPQLLLPIFDSGRNTSGLAFANAGQGVAVAQYEKSIQTAFREVADALASRSTLGEQLRAQQAQANAESLRFKLSDLRYQNGIASQLDVLDAQRSLFAARQAVVQIRLAQLQSQVTLYKALGGGWKDVAGSTSP